MLKSLCCQELLFEVVIKIEIEVDKTHNSNIHLHQIQ